jgi:hypothetical protein
VAGADLCREEIAMTGEDIANRSKSRRRVRSVPLRRIHVTSYCGTPAGRESFLAVHEALNKIQALPKTAS